jgi:hypothetical protein
MTIDFETLSRDILQQQYENTNINKLIEEKAKVFNKYIGNLSDYFVNEILNYNTCIAEALDYIWGKYFKISRTFRDKNGNLFVLSDDQFRELIKIKAFCTDWDGSIYSANTFLKELFKDRGAVYIIDNQTMSVNTFVFSFELDSWESWIFKNYDILPRPVGVATEILEIFTKYFGFIGFDDYVNNSQRIGFTGYEEEQEGEFLNYETTF